jgi:outer membrane protein assembly factor BamB
VYALRDGVTTPAPVWSAPPGADVVGLPVRAANGAIYAGTAAGRIYGLNQTTGATLWQKTVPSAIGTIIAIGDKRTVFSDGTGKVYAY